MHRLIVVSCFALTSLAADLHPLQTLIDASRTNSPQLKNLIASGLPGLQGRDGAAVWGQEFLFAVRSEQPASVSIDNEPPAPMK
ncbi:MAG TPA: hypothetical protein VER03_26385, partial [Bryobacteraceae bacterium]|nr:hypothetical protein [Bryobacteraceae bacterium]